MMKQRRGGIEMIKKDKEYDFKYTKKYGRDIDEIIQILREEFPINIKEIENKGLGFAVTSLIIHAVNYARQIK